MKDIFISSSVLIFAVLLLRLLFRNTISRRVQYALWLPVALRLLTPVSFGANPWSAASALQQVRNPDIAEIESAISDFNLPRMSYDAAYNEIITEYRAEGVDLSALDDSEADIRAFDRQYSGMTVSEALRWGWYVGTAVMAICFLAANLRFARKLRRTHIPLNGAGSKYPVRLCDDIASPCLFGLFRPAIYVTSEAAKDENRLRYVIAHEETHARHLDPLWSMLRGVCLVIWWFNPLVWLAAYCSGADCELACDEGALAQLGESARIPYGETLLALIPVRGGQNPMLAATTMTAGKRRMKERITRIAERRRPVAAALVLALTLSGVVCAGTFTGAERKRDAETAETGQAARDASGSYASADAYLDAVRAGMTTVTYSAVGGGEKTANVLSTRVAFLEKEGEVSGLAPDGTLELYSYGIETKVDVPLANVAIADAVYLRGDGWCDLEGQGGHTLVTLRRADGSEDVLFDRPSGDDRGGLYYYEEGVVEMLYDWYVREHRLDLPLYTTDLFPADESRSCPARRVDGESWYFYVPVHWYRDGEALRWVSSNASGSILRVRYLASEDECDLAPRSERSEWVVDAERKKLTYDDPQTHETLTAYLYGAPDGGCWQVLTRYDWTTSLYSDARGLEPGVLAAMAESFTLTSGRAAYRPEPPRAPSATEVLAMRERAEAGMSDDEIARLTDMIMSEHYWLEDKYLYRNSFREFSDPNSLSWNYFDQPGEIQIGWAYDGDVDKEAVCAREGLTEEAFFARYGQKVIDPNNTRDADSFRRRMTALKAGVKSGLLDDDFDRMIELCEQARETHNVGCVIELYHMLHDMDYYLLRYGPSDVGSRTRGPSIASEYYGCLSVWRR